MTSPVTSAAFGAATLTGSSALLLATGTATGQIIQNNQHTWTVSVATSSATVSIGTRTTIINSVEI